MGWQVDGGVRVEAVRAVLAERGHDPALAATSARALGAELKVGSLSPRTPPLEFNMPVPFC